MRFNYDYYSTPGDYDVHVYNEEIGSAFGATFEPNFENYGGTQYESVFRQAALKLSVPTYTSMDEQCADVYLGRSRVHYWNEDYSDDDPEGFDWEIRPDLVSNYYTELTRKNSRSTGRVLVSYTNSKGKNVVELYNYFDTPSEIMKMDYIHLQAEL